MAMIKLIRLLTAMIIAVGSASGGSAYAQSRSSVPGSIGVPGNIPVRPTPPNQGSPSWVGGPAGQAQNGLETAAAAQNYRLSKPQTDRAAQMVAAAPEQYELDRNGALAIRGEVLITGFDAAQLARLERAGFAVLRRSEISELGIELAVLSHEGMSAARALQRLRQILPDGNYDLNHVLFESGIGAGQTIAPPAAATLPAGGTAVVGLIDTGVAQTAEFSPRIRLIRRNFVPTQGSGALHGTAVASLLGRSPGRVTIYAADIFGNGARGGTTELLVRALGWMASEHVPVINISIVGPANALVANATRVMIGQGFTIVAPVGNDGAAARLLFPASYPGVVAVSGTDGAGRLLPEASRVKRVDFVAPGIATVTDPAGRAVIVRGTSFAAPLVSRQLAELVQIPNSATARLAVDRLARRAVHSGPDRKWSGHGLIVNEEAGNAPR